MAIPPNVKAGQELTDGTEFEFDESSLKGTDSHDFHLTGVFSLLTHGAYAAMIPPGGSPL
ncbi:MAG: hypothetical protein ACYCVG_03750 [Leptospirillum sp.]|jgi:hypothetical protein